MIGLLATILGFQITGGGVALLILIGLILFGVFYWLVSASGLGGSGSSSGTGAFLPPPLTEDTGTDLSAGSDDSYVEPPFDSAGFDREPETEGRNDDDDEGADSDIETASAEFDDYEEDPNLFSDEDVVVDEGNNDLENEEVSSEIHDTFEPAFEDDDDLVSEENLETSEAPAFDDETIVAEAPAVEEQPAAETSETAEVEESSTNVVNLADYVADEEEAKKEAQS